MTTTAIPTKGDYINTPPLQGNDKGSDTHRGDYFFYSYIMKRIKETPPAILAARKEVGASFRKARQLRHLTTLEVAEMVGICRETVTKIESANWSPTLDHLNKVAAALGVQVVVYDPLDVKI